MNTKAIAILLASCGLVAEGCNSPCSATTHAALLFEDNVDSTACGQHRFTDDESTTNRFIACVESAARDGRSFVAPINIGAFSHVPVENVLVGRRHQGEYRVFFLIGVQPNTAVAKVYVHRCTESLRLLARRNFTTGINLEVQCAAVADSSPSAGAGPSTGLVCGVDDSLSPAAQQPRGDAGAFADSSM